MPNPNIGYVRPEVTARLSIWSLVRDCLEGQATVKAKGDTYLPRPNKSDKSQENRDRYEAYLERAVFYNVTRRTLDGLVGQVFVRDPAVEIPETLEVLKADVDGAGVGLDQQAKKALADTMSFGRIGILVDYPPVDGAVSVEAAKKGFVRPTIVTYQPENIINWRTTTIGARKLLSLVVLKEKYTVDDDGFEAKTEDQWRVLRLTNGEYHVEVWRFSVNQAEPSKGEFYLYQMFSPKDAGGRPLTEIPFIMVGAINNDPDIDQAPLYDLAVLNVAHYRNSADYEEASFFVGQPTAWFSGLTENWVTNVMKGQVQLGSRAAVPLPENGQAGLLQVSPNSMPKEGMEHKERQMVALGARLIEQREVQRTLGEAQLEEASQASILTSVAKNISVAYKLALEWCTLFAGTSDEVKYDLNTDFPAARMTPEDRAQLVAEWQSSAISFTEMRDALRKAGVATQTDEDAKDEIESNPSPTAALAKDPMAGGNQNGRASPRQNGKTQPPSK